MHGFSRPQSAFSPGSVDCRKRLLLRYPQGSSRNNLPSDFWCTIKTCACENTPDGKCIASACDHGKHKLLRAKLDRAFKHSNAPKNRPYSHSNNLALCCKTARSRRAELVVAMHTKKLKPIYKLLQKPSRSTSSLKILRMVQPKHTWDRLHKVRSTWIMRVEINVDRLEVELFHQ